MAVNINHYTDNIVSSGSALLVNNFRVTTVGSGATIGAAGIVTYYGDGTYLTGVTATPTPAGSDTYIQFNDGGSLGSDSKFTFNKSTSTLNVNGKITVATSIDVGTGVTISSGGLNINSGIITATQFKKSGGTSSQFLKADGTVDSNTYLIAETDTLNSVTTRGNTTSNNITVGALIATSLSKSGGTSSQFLKADGTVDSNTYLTSYTETDTLNSVTGRGSSTTNSISVGSLTASVGGINVGTGVTISPTGLIANTGIVTAGQFIKPGGTSSQFLKADGSVDSSTYLTSVSTVNIGDDQVTYAKIQNVSATNRLLGRASAQAGDIEEITIGSGLQLTGTTLSATGGASIAGIDTAGTSTFTNLTVTGLSTFVGLATFGESVYLSNQKSLFFGNKFDILQNGSTQSIIRTQSGNNLFLASGGTVEIRNTDGSTISAVFTPSTDVALRYAGATQFRTTSTGVNLPTGRYEINDVSVLTGTTLGSGVVNSSLTNVGTLTGLNVSGVSTFSNNVKVGSAITFYSSAGIVSATKFYGDGSSLTGVTAAAAIVVQEEGSNVGTAATTFNFVGQGVTATYSGGTATITISGATSGGGSGTPGGSDTQIQFNDNSAFNGDSGLTYNKTTDNLSVTGGINIGTGVTISPNGIRINTGIVTANQFIVPGGTQAQFLKANGSVDNSSYLTSTGSIDSHTDVTITSPTNGQVLKFNGSEWVNDALIVGINTAGTSTFANLTVTGFSTFSQGIKAQSYVSFEGATYTASWNQYPGYFSLPDSSYITFGSLQDLTIKHDGTNSFITNREGDLIIETLPSGEGPGGDDIIIKSRDDFEVQVAGGTTAIYATGDGSVALTHNGSTKFETLGAGATVTGTTFTNQLSVADISYFYNDVRLARDGNGLNFSTNSSGSQITNTTTGDLILKNNLTGSNNIILNTKTDTLARFLGNAGVELYYDNDKKFETTGVGATVFGTLQAQQLNVSGVSTFSNNVKVGTAITFYASAGIVSATKFYGDGSSLTGVTAAAAIAVQEEGSIVGSAVTTLNFVGLGATATVSGGTATITISGGGGSGTPGGSDTQIQFNDGGSTFNGDSGLTYNKTTDNLSVTGGINIGTGVTISPNGLRINTGIVTTNNIKINQAIEFLSASGGTIYASGSGGTDGDNGIKLISNVSYPTLQLYARNDLSLNYNIINLDPSAFYPVTGSAVGSVNLGLSTAKWNAGYFKGGYFDKIGIGGTSNFTTPIGEVTLWSSGAILCQKIGIHGGSSSQFLKSDGSVDSNAYLTTTGSASNLTSLTGASAGTYGNGSQVAQITVSANGRITGISNVNITAGGGGGIGTNGSVDTVGLITASAFTGDGYDLRNISITPLVPYSSHSETSSIAYGLGQIVSYTQTGIVSGFYSVDSNDYFGSAVAMSADGKTFAVASIYDELPNGEADVGIVYVFDRQGYASTCVGIVTGVDGGNQSFNNWAGLQMSSDGKTLVAANRLTGSGVYTGGLVHIVDRVGYGTATEFRTVGILTSPNGGFGDNFGYSSALSADGKTLVIGASGETVGTVSGTGRAYVYNRRGNTFDRVGILTGSFSGDSDINDNFGHSVAISADGRTIFVGAVADEDPNASPFVQSTGLVYVFERVGVSTSGNGVGYGHTTSLYTQTQFIAPSIKTINGKFGASISCSADGNSLVVGSPSATDYISGSNLSGQVFVYDRDKTSGRFNREYILRSNDNNPSSSDYFGSVVSCSSDGTTILITRMSSASYIEAYRRSGNRFDIISAFTRGSGQYLGSGHAISADGKTFVVGAERDEISALPDRSGLAYIYERNTAQSVFANKNGHIGIGTSVARAAIHAVNLFSGNSAGIFSGASTVDLVRITQAGSGNAFVVEDEANPDSTPFVINPSGSVGIGTNLPGEKLHVVGIISASQFKGDGSLLTGVVAQSAGISVRDDSTLVGTASTLNFGTNLSCSINAQNIATVNVVIPSDLQNFWVNGTPGIGTISNVGIGTTIPTRSLTVVGSGASISNLYITGVATFQSNAYFGDNDKIYFGSSFNNAIFYDGANFEIGSTNQVRITGLSEPLAVFNSNGSVELYHNNSKKLDTTINGVLITGETSSTTKIYAPRIGYYSLYATHDFSTQTFTVTVSTKGGSNRYFGSGSSDAYYINGDESPFITFVPGKVYRFDQSDASNAGHPLRFYYDSAKTTQYTANVMTSGTAGTAGAYTEITVTDQTPLVLHYQCSNHALMGNAVQTNANHIDTPYLITARSGVNVTGVVTATDFNTTSDQNLKTNISTIEKPIEKLNQIRGVNFEWKSTNEKSIGVIAQEIEKVLPELVKINEDKKHVNYNGLIGLLIEVVKEQQEQIEELKRRIT